MIQKRLVSFITRSNWTLLLLSGIGGFFLFPVKIALGIICGGIIVTINFHLLARTLKKSLEPSNLASHNAILIKYYLRFAVSGLIIFVLISQHLINPLGLFVGLSLVVVSIIMATIREFTLFFFREAV